MVLGLNVGFLGEKRRVGKVVGCVCVLCVRVRFQIGVVCGVVGLVVYVDMVGLDGGSGGCNECEVFFLCLAGSLQVWIVGYMGIRTCCISGSGDLTFIVVVCRAAGGLLAFCLFVLPNTTSFLFYFY